MNLTNSVAMTTSEAMDQLIQPLRETASIQHFWYTQLFADGTRLLLSNIPGWTSLFHSQFYQQGLLNRFHHHYQSGQHFWPRETTVSQILREQFNVDYALSLVTKNEQSCEIATFAAHSQQSEVINWYLHHLPALKDFAVHFRARAKDLLNLAQQDRLILPTCLDLTAAEAILPWFKEKQCISPQASFTGRELQAANYLLQGKTAKETARAMQISYRTVEIYLDRLKEKLNAKNKLELTHKLSQLKLS